MNPYKKFIESVPRESRCRVRRGVKTHTMAVCIWRGEETEWCVNQTMQRRKCKSERKVERVYENEPEKREMPTRKMVPK